MLIGDTEISLDNLIHYLNGAIEVADAFAYYDEYEEDFQAIIDKLIENKTLSVQDMIILETYEDDIKLFLEAL